MGEVCFTVRRRNQWRAVIRERKRYPFALPPKVTHLDHRQSSLDLPGRVAGGYREGAEAIAISDQPSPSWMMKRYRRRLPGHEVRPPGICQLQNGEAAHALVDPATHMAQQRVHRLSFPSGIRDHRRA
jgi:hypothetical protein